MKSIHQLRQLRRSFDQSLLAKDHNYDTEKYNCLICYEPATHPVQCHKCKLMACHECAHKIIATENPCPKKCSQGIWKILKLKPLGLELNCPFDKRCETTIYPQTFDKHMIQCLYAPKQFKKVKINKPIKRQYLCRSGHPLSFIGSSQKILVISERCTLCSAFITRSKCNTCNEHYCGSCRYPKGLTIAKCPQGHPFLEQESQASMCCDMCDKPVLHCGSNLCYNDSKCDFAVCLECLQNLDMEFALEEIVEEMQFEDESA